MNYKIKIPENLKGKVSSLKERGITFKLQKRRLWEFFEESSGSHVARGKTRKLAEQEFERVLDLYSIETFVACVESAKEKNPLVKINS
jgi:hypothetical protein